MAHDEGAPLTGRKRRRPRLPSYGVVDEACGDCRSGDPERVCKQGCEARAEAAAMEEEESK